MAILVGAGLAGLAGFASSAQLARLGIAWIPPAIAALVTLGLAVMLAGPLRAGRQTFNRTDNLRLASAIVAARERPGDVVFYIPDYRRVFGTGYPAPFLRLRDIALAESPIASATLTGTEIISPQLLKSGSPASNAYGSSRTTTRPPPRRWIKRRSRCSQGCI